MARALEKVRRAAELKKGIWFIKGNKKGRHAQRDNSNNKKQASQVLAVYLLCNSYTFRGEVKNCGWLFQMTLVFLGK